jgi:hypothetical protein
MSGDEDTGSPPPELEAQTPTLDTSRQVLQGEVGYQRDEFQEGADALQGGAETPYQGEVKTYGPYEGGVNDSGAKLQQQRAKPDKKPPEKKQEKKKQAKKTTGGKPKEGTHVCTNPHAICDPAKLASYVHPYYNPDGSLKAIAILAPTDPTLRQLGDGSRWTSPPGTLTVFGHGSNTDYHIDNADGSRPSICESALADLINKIDPSKRPILSSACRTGQGPAGRLAKATGRQWTAPKGYGFLNGGLTPGTGPLHLDSVPDWLNNGFQTFGPNGEPLQ